MESGDESQDQELFAISEELYTFDQEKEDKYKLKHPERFTEEGERITRGMRKETAR